MKEKHKTLKKLIGGWAYRALTRDCPLQIWRRSTPHNWFIESERDNMLWHSSEFDSERPDLRLFKIASDSEEKMCQYWGADSGAPELSMYILRNTTGGSAK